MKKWRFLDECLAFLVPIAIVAWIFFLLIAHIVIAPIEKIIDEKRSMGL